MKLIVEKNSRSKSSILDKVRSWEWASILANFLTIATLWYTIYSNNEKDKDEKIELDRIRVRDSIQLATNNTLLSTMIDDNKLHRIEANTNRINDSIQLSNYNRQHSLLNRSLNNDVKLTQIQNENFLIQKKSYQADLSLNINFNSYTEPFGSYNNYLSVLPKLTIHNSGNSAANNITIKLIVLTVDTWDKKIINCNKNTLIDTYDLNLDPNQSEPIKNINYQSILSSYSPEKSTLKGKMFNKLQDEQSKDIDAAKKKGLTLDPNQLNRYYSSKRDEIELKYPNEAYRNYIITEISYNDRFQKEKKYLSKLNKITIIRPSYRPSPNTPKTIEVSFKLGNAILEDIQTLKYCLVENNFNYEYLLNNNN